MGLIGDIPGFGWTSLLHGTPLVIFLVISILVILFLGIALRSFALAFKLGSIAKQIPKNGREAELLRLPVFKTTEPYKHLWSEYADTLHS